MSRSFLRMAVGLSIYIWGASDASAVFRFIHEELGMVDHQMGMSGVWGDYDGNGYPDLFLNGYRRHPEILYQNMGGTFRRADTESGVGAAGQSGFGSGWADYDNDGDLDLYVVNTDGQVSFFYRNDGPNETGTVTFTDVASNIGMSSPTNGIGAAWTDYDGDGHLDLFVANSAGQPDLLYHNLGNGTFDNVGPKAGMADTLSGGGCAWADYDNDGRMDLFVNNSSGNPKFLYRNNGNGTFTNVARDAGVAEQSDGQGCAWADYDADGDMDLFVSNYGTQPNYLYQNRGDGTFLNVAQESGFLEKLKYRGAAWADYDNDGDFDIFIGVDWGNHDRLYRNNGNGTFSDVSIPMGFVGSWAISVSWADYDNDGRMDAYVSTQVSHQDLFYRNEDTRTLNWIKVNPVTAGPRDRKKGVTELPFRLAIGSKVEVDLDGGADFSKGLGRYAAALVGAGDGFGTGALPVHFGARRAKAVDIRVTFPTGKVVTLDGVPVNQTVTIKDR